MPRHDVIVIGASAGGVEAIATLVAGLPRDLHASVLIVLHISRGRSLLPEILSRSGRLPAIHPPDGEPLQYSRIYVAPPDHHMIVEHGCIRIAHSAEENGVRPAVDPLFRSAARVYGSRVVGVVLTGALDDGTAGMAAVKRAGGVTVVQDPEEAFAPSMPRSAMGVVRVDHVLPLREIPALLVALAQEEARRRPMPGHTGHLAKIEPDLGVQPLTVVEADRPGRVSVVTCPQCHGTLWEAEEDSILRFRCRVGHIYSPESMLAAQTDSVGRALWTAVRTLEERAALMRRMSDRARARDQHSVAHMFAGRSHHALREADAIRRVVTSRVPTPDVPDHSSDPGGPGDPEGRVASKASEPVMPGEPLE